MGSDVGFSWETDSAVTAQLHKCTKSINHTLRGMEKPGIVPRSEVLCVQEAPNPAVSTKRKREGGGLV